MKRFAGIAMIGLMVASCDGKTSADADGDGEITAEEMADITSAAVENVRPQAGQYRSTTQLLEIDLPGAPREVVDMMRSRMSGRKTEYCLTQEEVDKGFEEMARQSQQGDCSFNRFEISGGEMEAEMSCSTPEGGVTRMTMAGTGTPTSSDMTMNISGSIPGMGDAKMVMNVKAERIGDCDEGK